MDVHAVAAHLTVIYYCDAERYIIAGDDTLLFVIGADILKQRPNVKINYSLKFSCMWARLEDSGTPHHQEIFADSYGEEHFQGMRMEICSAPYSFFDG